MKKRNTEDFEFGLRLKKFRLKNRMSADVVAKSIGVAPSTYRDWESGRAVSGQPYKKLAQTLGVTVNQLLDVESNSDYRQLTYEALSEIEKIVTKAKTYL